MDVLIAFVFEEKCQFWDGSICILWNSLEIRDYLFVRDCLFVDEISSSVAHAVFLE